ncbi:MAG TPA: hypothetical protein VM934_13020 [Pyrinomonadaceae bacterium]|nr:hypothetical protein [Pyrinomonadaceae bacterium]
MRRWKKVALLLTLLLILSQTPFIYRRYRLGHLHAAIETLRAQRDSAPADDNFREYKGVIHVHSALGGHSTGEPEEIVRAARANGLDFVVMTEHPSAYIDTAGATLKGVREGVLFVNGSEVVAAGGERLFVLPGIPAPLDGANPSTAQDLVTRTKADGRLAFVAYPEQVRDWRLQGFDGIEVYNLYTNTKRINYALLFFDGLWSYGSYPELLFSTFYEKPDANLKRWDEINSSGNNRAVAIAGNDAHSNVGLSLQEQTGEKIFEIKLDPYERSFRLVRNHVLLEKGAALDAETLLSALRLGHSFISFDLFSDADGFRFTAESASERRLMGDEIALPEAGGVRLGAATPLKARIVFLRDGQVIHEERETRGKELVVDRRGVYRVEVYLDQLGGRLKERPWIISNPIYVR